MYVYIMLLLHLAFCFVSFPLCLSAAETFSPSADIRVLVIVNAQTDTTTDPMAEFIKTELEAKNDLTYEVKTLFVLPEVSIDADFCLTLKSGTSLIIDLTLEGFSTALEQSMGSAGVPYFRLDSTNKQFLLALSNFLQGKRAENALFVMPSEEQLNHCLVTLLKIPSLKLLATADADSDEFRNLLSSLKRSPANLAFLGSTSEVLEASNTTWELTRRRLRRDAGWLLAPQGFLTEGQLENVTKDTVVLELTREACCAFKASCQCSDLTSLPLLISSFHQTTINNFHSVFLSLRSDGFPLHSDAACDSHQSNNATLNAFHNYWTNVTGSAIDHTSYFLPMPLEFKYIQISDKGSNRSQLGTWSLSKGFLQKNTAFESPRRYFRFGTLISPPWVDYERKIGGEILLDGNGHAILQGFCIDLIAKLSKRMNLDYDVVVFPAGIGHPLTPADNSSQEWSGLIGGLTSGDIDIAVAPMSMSSDRAHVVDFVTPHFAQSGISIVMRAVVPERDLFKFIKVLKWEVWLGIIGAIAVTAMLLLLLDRYSTYTRERTYNVSESIWHVTLSLTPQGGSTRPPQAWSARILVATYWLFLALIIATFTANLAASLTVARMQTPVASLAELAAQKGVNYSVLADSEYLRYFENMAGAEEQLYRVWTEMALDTQVDMSKFRVWDYPIREQYKNVLKSIRQTGVVQSVEEGFDMLERVEAGTFAFIHDEAQVEHKVLKNCRLTLVGDSFARQPYALAVQQGSSLRTELGLVVLQLQKDGALESLRGSYWNVSSKADCPVMDDSEGLTLHSIGGLFIVSGAGHVLSAVMIVVVQCCCCKKSSEELKEKGNAKVQQSSEEKK